MESRVALFVFDAMQCDAGEGERGRGGGEWVGGVKGGLVERVKGVEE